MTGSAISIGPWALVIAVIAYVLKRWWDTANDITKERRVAYFRYYAACYSLVRIALDENALDRSEKLVEAHEALQASTPEFFFHASPTAMILSDIFYERALPFVYHKVGSQNSSEFVEQARLLSEALNVLREFMKAEIYSFSPRFQFERLRHKRKYESFMRDAGK